MKKSQNFTMTDAELRAMFEQHGIKMPKSYKCKTTGTLCFHVKHQTFAEIDKLSKKYGINRSQVVQLIVDSLV